MPSDRTSYEGADTAPEKTVALLGIPLELGAGTPGALMGPAALRTAGLPVLLQDLGYGVADHGDLAPPAAADVVMAPQDAERCRNLREVAAWTRANHDRAYELAGTGGIPVFLGGDPSNGIGRAT